ncbi:unnamed protein product [Urochloa decumbens]|uniref:Disease resistance protein RPM1 n=1 Tax=Urochloa decumbens TaxID=240449 RepID=A0ABC9AIE8_9POAL
MADAIVGPLLSKLQDVAVTEAKALAAVGGEIEKLGDKLMWLQALVYETDLRSRHDGSRFVRVLACQVREVAFEAEDAVDQFYLKGDLSRRFGLSQRFGRNWGRAAVEFIVNFRTHICVRFILSSRIQSMNARLEEIINNNSKYGMVQGSSGDGMAWRASRAIAPMRDDWENLSVKFELKGRKNEKEELEKKLMDDSAGPDVIHVVGVGGIGKRALLRQACESEPIKGHFPVRLCMSFPRGVSDSSIIAKQIKEKVDKELSWCNKPGQVARCLVVIESPIRATTWSNVEPKLLQKAGHGSKIVMLAEASRQEQMECIIELKNLSKSVSITLFNHEVGLAKKRRSDYATAMMNTIRENIEAITSGSKIKNKSCKNEPTLMRKLLHGSPFLRVIHLEGLDLGPELPDKIGEMVHLQYLLVRHRGLKKLPSSVGNLGRLQTVDVRGTEVRELPKSLWKIQTLRHVLGDRFKFPKSTGDLKLMQTLETVAIQHVHNVHMWCKATGKRRKQFGLRFLHKLRIVELKVSQQEDLETILKDLSYLESLGASSVVGACLDHVASLELDGKLLLCIPDENLGFSSVPRCLLSLTRLVLRRTNIRQYFIHVIAKLPTLAELEMQNGSYVGEEVVFCNHGFNSLAVLRITSLVNLKRITVHTVTTRRNKAIEPKFIEMYMAKIDNFEPNTSSCSFCNTTIIRGQVDVWQHPRAVGNNQANLSDEEGGTPPCLPSYR